MEIFLSDRKNIFWGYAAQLLNIGAGLIILPAVVTFLSPDEVGLWFVFISIAGIAQLLELGFQPILIRNFSYVYAGAKNLTADGVPECCNDFFNQELFSDLFVSAKYIYSIVSMLASLLLFGAGTAYIFTLLTDSVDQTNAISGWLLYSAGLVISFYYGYLNAVLQGRGEVAEANKIIFLSKIFFVIFGASLLFFDFGLVGMGVASIASTVLSRFMARRIIFSKNYPEVLKISPTKGGAKIVSCLLWYNASRFGVVLLGVFLIWRANVLIAASLLGLSDAASYGLAVQLFFMLNSVSSVPLNISLPKINTLQAQGNTSEIYKTFCTILVFSLCMYIVAALFLMVFGNAALTFISSPTKLPDTPILGLMAVVFFLELNHGSCANFISTRNKTPFATSSIMTGVAIVLISSLITPCFGVWGLVAAQGSVQILYNNWKWPLEAAKLLKASYSNVLRDGVFFIFKFLERKF